MSSKRFIIIAVISLMLLWVNYPAFAVTKITDHFAWSLGRLKELEGYVSRWQAYVATEIAQNNAPDFQDIVLQNADINGVTFVDIDITGGTIVINLNTGFGLDYLNGKSITLTPVGADTDEPPNGFLDVVTGWTCTTNIPTLYKWNVGWDILSQLEGDLANCVHNS